MKVKYKITLSFDLCYEDIYDEPKSSEEMAQDIGEMVCDECTMFAEGVGTYTINKHHRDMEV